MFGEELSRLREKHLDGDFKYSVKLVRNNVVKKFSTKQER